jgi:hypothetical protein
MHSETPVCSVPSRYSTRIIRLSRQMSACHLYQSIFAIFSTIHGGSEVVMFGGHGTPSMSSTSSRPRGWNCTPGIDDSVFPSLSCIVCIGDLLLGFYIGVTSMQRSWLWVLFLPSKYGTLRFSSVRQQIVFYSRFVWYIDHLVPISIQFHPSYSRPLALLLIPPIVLSIALVHR